MTRAEKRLKEKCDLNSRLRNPQKTEVFILNPTRKTISHGVEVNWFRSRCCKGF